MTKRRDLFIFAPEPNKVDEAKAALSSWLRELDGHPGYLGGSVLDECAGELLPVVLVLVLEFESTEAARALWPKIENSTNPLYPDDKMDKRPDQGAVLFSGHGHDHSPDETHDLPSLFYNRGGGLFARLLHVHAAAIDDFKAHAA